MRLLSLSEVSIQPRMSRLKLPNSVFSACIFIRLLRRGLAACSRHSLAEVRRSAPETPFARVFGDGRDVRKRRQNLFNFRRLILGCIDTSDSESRRIFQDFSKSTRSAFFCTAPNLNFSEICQSLPNYGDFCKFLRKFQQNPENLRKF